MYVLYNYRPGILTICTPTFAVYDVPVAADGSELLAGATSVVLTITAGVVVAVALPVPQ
jgi:hypothetical protein